MSARSAVGVQLRTFTGAPSFDSNGHVVVPHPDPVRYVGKPTPEVDEAWERLVGGRYFLISEDEARATWGDDEYRDYWSWDRGGYVAG